uniref:Uncharacterized protein n=1 Tax=Anopheles christyi TaxID=43041 RepID=A0A182KCN2_9DIPT
MSPAFLAVIAVILCILFRILNVSSTPQIPSIVCKDGQFMECFNKIAPMLREPFWVSPSRSWLEAVRLRMRQQLPIYHILHPWLTDSSSTYKC